jgi:hypothetical protein
MEPYSAGAAEARFEPATAPNGTGGGQEAPLPTQEPMDTVAPAPDAAPEAAPPPPPVSNAPAAMDVSAPAPEPAPEPMEVEEPERDAPEPVAPEEDAPPAPFAPREAPESEMPAPAPETTPPPVQEPAAAPRDPSPEPEAPEAPEAAAPPEPEAAAEPMAPEPEPAPAPESPRPVAARMSSEAEAAALLEATTTTVATAAAALEAEAAKPDELQLEIEAARAKARAAQDGAAAPPAANDADAAPAPVVSEKPPLTEDARSLVDRAAPIEVLQDNPKKGESAKRFRKYMAATNAAEFIQLGGTRADLKYDIARGWVTVTDRAPPPAREKKAKQERGELVFEQNIPKLRSQVPPPTKDDEAIARAAQCVCVRKSHFMTAVERPRHRRDVCSMARRLTTVSTQAR